MNLQSIKQRFGIIGRSLSLDNAISRAAQVAGTDLTALITGESGVGKENFSKIIHKLSARKHNNFIAINCGAIPEGTINSELFGHDKGAFTGASSDRKGYFETVNGGTIFLDEIGEMPLETQSRLLRLLESGEFIRVGSSKVQKTDVRVVAATNVELINAIQEGKFREDLFYRLSTVPIEVPPLRKRKEDINILFRKFAVDFAEKYRTSSIQLTADAQHLIEHYYWPGNVRELKNVAEQLSVLSKDKIVNASDVLSIAPQLDKRNLPTLHKKKQGGAASYEERELLYKLLFDMKTDLNDLKSLVFGLINNNNLRVPDSGQLKQLQQIKHQMPEIHQKQSPVDDYSSYEYENKVQENEGLFISQQSEYEHAEEVDSSLKLADMEKSYIEKALIKYKGRRKDAANELGISERTLFRKIKKYNIEE